MKITHTKKKSKRWTIILESEEEAINLVHVFGCRNALYFCARIAVREDKFQQGFYNQLLSSGILV